MRIFVLIILIFSTFCSKGSKPVYTQVTFMYDIKRGDLNSRLNRPFSFYLSYFKQLLATDSNLIIFASKQLRQFIWDLRQEHNTVFIEKQLDSYHQFWYNPLVQKLRKKYLQDPNFQLKGHPQFGLQHYNLIMYSKLYMMTQAVKYDKWNTDILVWTDGGYMHQFPRSIISPENVVKKFYQLIKPQWIFITYYEPNQIFAGFQRGELRYIDRRTKFYQSILASNMGGYIHVLRDIKCAFENLLRITLENGDMNSDETPLTLMPIKYSFLIQTTVNTFLNNFVNKFHIYEDVSRISVFPRYWKGIVDSQGKISVIYNKNISKNDKNFNKQNNFSDRIPAISLMQLEKLNSIKEIQIAKLSKLREIITRRKQTEIKMTYIKSGFFIFFCILYLILLIKNRNFKAALSKKTQEASQLKA